LIVCTGVQIIPSGRTVDKRTLIVDNTGMNDSIELADQLVKSEACRRVIDYRIQHPRATVEEACEACDVARRSFYTWMKEGVLDEYLSSIQGVATKTAAQVIAQGWLDVLKHQIALASGKKVQRGANPTAAAKFLAELAQLNPQDQKARHVAQVQVTFLPEQMVTDGGWKVLEPGDDAESSQ